MKKNANSPLDNSNTHQTKREYSLMPWIARSIAHLVAASIQRYSTYSHTAYNSHLNFSFIPFKPEFNMRYGLARLRDECIVFWGEPKMSESLILFYVVAAAAAVVTASDAHFAIAIFVQSHSLYLVRFGLQILLFSSNFARS